MSLTLRKINDDGKNKILANLNDQQVKAVRQIDGPLLVIAGAGSGKTRVLTHRIAYLIDQQIAPWNILALTFTNKAALEMKSRISGIVPPEAVQKVWAGTFHSIFARILRTEADKIGYTSSFSIYDTDDSLSLIRSIMSTAGINNKQFPAQGLRSRISWAKNRMVSVQDYIETADNSQDKQTAFVYEAYEESLKKNNAMDFDDLLLKMIELLNSSPEVLNKYQNRFKYILVDEYQDTNRAQYIVINKLAKAHKNICVVGDDAQSIYRWRGADIRNILDFKKDYPDAKLIALEQNYRSTKTIIEAAGSVIKYNANQIQKNLWTENKIGEPIDVMDCRTDKEEAEKISYLISKKRDEGYSAGDIAVLYRTNAQSLSIENSLRQRDLPYVIIGGISFYKRKEIKDTIAYLRLLYNPQDGESLSRIINEPPRGIGLTSLRHLSGYAQRTGKSLLNTFLNVDLVTEVKPKPRAAVKKFTEMIEKYLELKNQLKPGELAMKYIEETGLLDMYKEINTEDALDRWNNIQQLLSDISLFFRQNEAASFDDYLQQIALATDYDEKDTEQDQIKLMTLHTAKGLEFPVVFIAGLEQGLFPLSRQDMSVDEEEEERRLFYVGITRAEEKLYLSFCRQRYRFGDIKDQSPSSFINEVDSKYLRWEETKSMSQHIPGPSLRKTEEEKKLAKWDTNSNYQKQLSLNMEKKKQAEQKRDKPGRPPKIEMGDKVKHSHFGMGKVLAIAGTGANAKAVIMFDSVGRKVIMLQYARLEKL
jgi:DNA helicase-2/ATP-dependent DNA helicase PcrA